MFGMHLKNVFLCAYIHTCVSPGVFIAVVRVVNRVTICTCLFAHSQGLVLGSMVLAYCQLSFESICFASLLGVDH